MWFGYEHIHNNSNKTNKVRRVTILLGDGAKWRNKFCLLWGKTSCWDSLSLSHLVSSKLYSSWRKANCSYWLWQTVLFFICPNTSVREASLWQLANAKTLDLLKFMVINGPWLAYSLGLIKSSLTKTFLFLTPWVLLAYTSLSFHPNTIPRTGNQKHSANHF